jgi:hypothetical protein
MPFSIMLPYRAKQYQHLNIKKTQMPKSYKNKLPDFERVIVA